MTGSSRDRQSSELQPESRGPTAGTIAGKPYEYEYSDDTTSSSTNQNTRDDTSPSSREQQEEEAAQRAQQPPPRHIHGSSNSRTSTNNRGANTEHEHMSSYTSNCPSTVSYMTHLEDMQHHRETADSADVNALKSTLENIAFSDINETVPWTQEMEFANASLGDGIQNKGPPSPPQPLNEEEIVFFRRFMRENDARFELRDIVDEEAVPFALDEAGDPIYEPGPRVKALRKIRDEEENPTSTLSEDSFSFIISASVKSVPFVVGSVVFVLKGLLFSLICINLIDLRDEGNVLSIPAGVSPGVAVAQFLAMFIAVASQDDLRTAMNYMLEGYDAKTLGTAFIGVGYTKWLAAIWAQFLEGSFGLATTFLLIVTSDDVVGLILDFTAVEFITLLDNTAFVLAYQGFMGKTNKREAELIKNTEYKIHKKRQKTLFRQIGTLSGTFAILLVCWGILFSLQLSGHYMTKSITVQFDDDLTSQLGAYSGSYTLQIRPGLSISRVSYVAVNGDGVIGYCDQGRYWTFSFENNNNYDACSNYAARSSETLSYDILVSNQDQWYATEDSNQQRFFPMENFFLDLTCDQDSDCGGVGRGVCDSNTCVCTEGFYGIRCDYQKDEACEEITVDERLRGFQGGRQFASTYQVLRDANQNLVQAYHHPVYVADPRNSVGLDVMMYSGLRWVLTNSLDGLPQLTNHTFDDLAAYLTSIDFHAAVHLQSLSFYTEPVFFNTPDDEDSPVGRDWFPVLETNLANTERVGTIETIMLCAVCNDNANPCQNDNTCNTTVGTCDCNNGADGSLCQITPLSNGKCDVYFNTASYKFDGGDCCQATCVSNPTNSCGIVTSGVLNTVDQGFPFCSDPSIIRSCGNERCWAPTSSSLASFSNEVTTLTTVADNGRIFALAAPSLSVVYVYDQEDSQWNQRGPLLNGSPGSEFGRIMAISTLPGAVVGTRFGKIPILLAIGSIDDDNGHAIVRVVRWRTNGIDWSPMGNEIDICGDSTTGCELLAMDIGRVGNQVTLVVVRSDNQVLIYNRRLTENGCGASWEVSEVIDGSTQEEMFGNYNAVSLSGKATMLGLTRDESFEVYYRGDNGLFNLVNKNSRNTTADVNSLEEVPVGSVTQITSIKLSVDETSMIVFCKAQGEVDFAVRYEFRPNSLARPPFIAEPIAMAKFRTSALPPASIARGLSFARFSADASTVAVRVSTSGGPRVRLATYMPAKRRFELKSDPFPKSITRNRPLNNDFIDKRGDFGLSYNGGTYFQVGDEGPESYRMVPICTNGAKHYRMSLTLDENAANVSWALETYQTLGNLTFRERSFEECNNCYAGDARFAMSIVAEDACVVATQDPCTRIRFQSDVGLGSGAGIVVLREGEEMDRYAGSATEPFFSRANSESASSCTVSELKCKPDEVHILVEMSLDNFSSDTSWALQDSKGAAILDGSNYSLKDDRTTILSQICSSNNDTFKFTVFDDSGDGLCCDFGFGGYTIYADYQRVYTLSGNRDFLIDTITFSSSGDLITNTVPITIEIQKEENSSLSSPSLESLDGSEIWWRRQDLAVSYLSETVYLPKGGTYRLTSPNNSQAAGVRNVYWGTEATPNFLMVPDEQGINGDVITVSAENIVATSTQAPVTPAPVTFSPAAPVAAPNLFPSVIATVPVASNTTETPNSRAPSF